MPNNDLILDSGTKRLLEIGSEPHRSDDDIQTILSIVNTLAPRLLDGLTQANCQNIAKGLEIRCYQRDEVLFRQGDPPDAYYTVVRGAVSIYARSEDNVNGETTCRDGKLLCQLPPGASFGELSFNANGKHSPRNAGVVSDGSHGQSKVMVRSNGTGGSKTTTNGGGMVEVEASDVAVLLCINEGLYMSELFPRHAAKHSTKDKLDFLRSSLLFRHWTADQLIKLAYAMKKKTYAEGTVLVREGGEHFEFVYFIRKGRVKVQSAIKGGTCKNGTGMSCQKRPFSAIHSEKNANKKNDLSATETERGIDIAFLGNGEMVGLVEIATKSKKMRRTIIATKRTDVFVVPVFAFYAFLAHQDKTREFIEKMAKKRMDWEALRLDYAAKFPTMPHTLPKKWARMSSYMLHPDSILTEVERRRQNVMQTIETRKLREAKARYRVATMETFSGGKRAEDLAKAEALCQEARGGASGAFRCDKKISAFLREVADVEKMIRDGD